MSLKLLGVNGTYKDKETILLLQELLLQKPSKKLELD